jgi:hypothetical protein
MLGHAPGVRSKARWFTYFVILGAALAYPALQARTETLELEAASLRARAAELERSRAELEAVRGRVERARQLSAAAEALLAADGAGLADASQFARRQVSVTQQSFSRSQAEAWLRGFDADEAGFLVIDAFSIKVMNAGEGLFDESPDPDRLAQLLVSLKGEYIGRGAR